MNLKTLFSLLLFIVPLSILAQNLEDRNLEIKASYPLKSDGVDSTGNYGEISFGDHKFIDGSILSKGCVKINDTCLIVTPQIDALLDKAFAIQIEFKISKFGGAIIQAGNGYRYLGMATTGTGNFGMKTGSQKETIFNDVQLVLDKWYMATILHNTADSMTEVFLGNKLIGTLKQYLDHPTTDNQISNIDHSRGIAFSGYLKNLRVLSSSDLKPSTINPKKKYRAIFSIAKSNEFIFKHRFT